MAQVTPGASVAARHPARRQTPPTATDVAKRAGVSQSTVSLVLAGKGTGRVSQQTQDHVRRIAHDMGYRPNAAAQTLRLGYARSLALVVPDVENPFFATVLRGAEWSARAAGFSVVLVDERESPEWAHIVVDGLRSGAFAGSMLYAPEPGDIDLISAASNRVVIVEAKREGLGGLHLDIEGGARVAMEHLLGLGHRRIAHFAADYPKASFEVRRRTWRSVLTQAGVGTLDEVASRWEPEAARTAIGGLLSGDRRPTAVFCDDDLLAPAVYYAARTLGLSVPSDLSVVGFGDIFVARILNPELTTVAIPADKIGRLATTLLINELEGEGHQPVADVTLALELRIRGSTARPAN